jgi:hypothetical protein
MDILFAAYQDAENFNDNSETVDIIAVNSKVTTKTNNKRLEKIQSPDDSQTKSSTSHSNKKGSSVRVRLSVEVKKGVVDAYYEHVNMKNTEDSSESVDIYKSPSMRAYVTDYNKNPANLVKLDISSLSRWIQADSRGEYLPWNGINKMHSHTCKLVNIVRHIDHALKTKDPSHGKYNQVIKRKSMSGEYGVIARSFTPAGTFLGFCEGEVIDGLEASRSLESLKHVFILTENRLIDTKDWYSCFARYYNCALKACDQNVCVERLSSQTNPQKVICFIANRDVQKGEEFLISFASACWEGAADTSPPGSPFSIVHNALLCAMPANHETLKPLLSTSDAYIMANRQTFNNQK